MEMSETERIRAAVPGLVWSNTKAPVEASIRAALTRPSFFEILKIVSLIGLACFAEDNDTLSLLGSGIESGTRVGGA